MAPQLGERILDLCAAPGGKATHVLSLMRNQGPLVANDVHTRRVQALAGNLERWGATNAVILHEMPDRLAYCFQPSSTECWWMPPAPVRGCSADACQRANTGAWNMCGDALFDS